MEKVPMSAKSLLAVHRNKFRNFGQAGRKDQQGIQKHSEVMPLERFCEWSSL